MPQQQSERSIAELRSDISFCTGVFWALCILTVIFGVVGALLLIFLAPNVMQGTLSLSTFLLIAGGISALTALCAVFATYIWRRREPLLEELHNRDED